MAAEGACVVGVDFGTLSGRAVVVRASDGAELGSAVYEFPHGAMDRTLASSGASLPPQWALQDPGDWVGVLRTAVPAALKAAGVAPADVDRDRHRLHRLDAAAGAARRHAAVLARGARRPPARVAEAVEAPRRRAPGRPHQRARRGARRAVAARYGGRISSEWEFAKALQVLEEDPEVYERMERWVEGADWIIWQLCGVETRNLCTAGYKAHPPGRPLSVRGLPARAEPGLRRLRRDADRGPAERRSATAPATSPRRPPEWTGLPEGIAVAVGNVDAHVTVPAAGATGPGQMAAIMGTSTCHMMNGDELAVVPGMCGVVRDGIVPGPVGLRGRPERRRRHLRLVRGQPGAAALPRRGARARPRPARAPVGARRRAGARRRPGWSRSTGTTATARCSSTTSSAG